MSRQPQLLRALSRHDRAVVLACLVLLVALCWAWLIPAAVDMQTDMDGLSAWMMQTRWDLRYGVLVLLMWIVMMIGMMLPSAVPALMVFEAVCRNAQQPAVASRVLLFAAGYLCAWGMFSVLATALQWQLSRSALLSPMLMLYSRQFGAAVLIVAGLYQWTPLKGRCLSHCRAPVAWVAEHWRDGAGGAWRMGVHHGLFCVGCCWALMLLLFVGGVMSLAWIAGITAFVWIEKLSRWGEAAGRWAGAGLVGAGLIWLAQAF